MKKMQKNIAFILEKLCKRYPTPETHLIANNPWELLVATVLSAQCTDERVNKVTPVLFAKWATPSAISPATHADIEKVIYSTGFYKNKAKNILRAAQILQEKYKGTVPQTLAELITLPGVARKTANVVLWNAFGINEGIAVDTHVKRITFRLGLTENTDPVAVEKDLMALFPHKEWGLVNHRLVWFGRHVCNARTPQCPSCELNPICPKHGVHGESA